MDAPRHLAFRWIAVSPSPGRDYQGEPGPANSTRVDLQLSRDGDATRVQVTEAGFDQLDIPAAERAARHEANATGWPRILERLREYSAERQKPA